MIQSFINSERPIATVAAFILTYFVVLSLGRFFKRRAHVPLGFSFQIFCLTLAFYAAITVYGVQANWRNHVGAALVLLSSILVVAFVNRYLWDFYFEKKRQTPIPHFLREVFALIIFLIALLIVLSVGYHASAQLRGMVVGSGVAAIILGLAGQNLLSGIIAGVSLQMNRPYKVGDWLRVGETFGEVREINWRSTRLRTNDDIYLDIPNSEIVKTTIVNLHYPTEAHAMRIRVGVDYNVPPNRVKDALARAAQSGKNVLPEPAVRVFLVDFADHAVIYEIKYYMGNHARINETNDSVRTNVWYELKRQRITIPYPKFCAASHSFNVWTTSNSTPFCNGRALTISAAVNASSKRARKAILCLCFCMGAPTSRWRKTAQPSVWGHCTQGIASEKCRF
ncbi:MAG: hypothetical protein DMF40_01725 [Verrucomicrobia bacterium]|nr:MAG: hypothetical protein DMF40_01725 [Verrucomicrobiota bacterium]